jgi:hypothetical protein
MPAPKRIPQFWRELAQGKYPLCRAQIRRRNPNTKNRLPQKFAYMPNRQLGIRQRKSQKSLTSLIF